MRALSFSPFQKTYEKVSTSSSFFFDPYPIDSEVYSIKLWNSPSPNPLYVPSTRDKTSLIMISSSEHSSSPISHLLENSHRQCAWHVLHRNTHFTPSRFDTQCALWTKWRANAVTIALSFLTFRNQLSTSSQYPTKTHKNTKIPRNIDNSLQFTPELRRWNCTNSGTISIGPICQLISLKTA
jgi:hypothetical protein